MKYENLAYTQENILKVATDYMSVLNQEMSDNDYSLLSTIEYKGIITGVGFVVALFNDKKNFDIAVDFLNNPPVSGSF